jgi:squalene-associated FAD-dependent desaturase
MPSTVHIIGAGLAGLAAAVRLSAGSTRVVVYEAANQAGGRCRSYDDPALGMAIDNGNHLLLSGNDEAATYLRGIGAAERLIGPPQAEYHFVDLASGERWLLRPNDGRLPWWIFVPQRRVPGTKSYDYLRLARLLRAAPNARAGDVLDCNGTLYHRLLRPVLLAALNTDPREASAALAAAVMRGTLAAGGQACRPLIARDGLGAAFIEPALALLRARGAAVHFGHRLRALFFTGGRVTGLDFGDDRPALAAGDAVILAVPPVVAAALLPELQVPTEFRAIVNAHFRIAPPPGLPPIVGVVNGTIEWLFAFPERLSVTISAADRLLETPREELAAEIWRDVCAVAGIEEPLPRWQIVRERRATFAATPEQDVRRPPAQTAYANLVLAGDWTDTGLPATIESAVVSGHRAAALVAARPQ